jgi:hypothetical protein
VSEGGAAPGIKAVLTIVIVAGAIGLTPTMAAAGPLGLLLVVALWAGAINLEKKVGDAKTEDLKNAGHDALATIIGTVVAGGIGLLISLLLLRACR